LFGGSVVAEDVTYNPPFLMKSGGEEKKKKDMLSIIIVLHLSVPKS